MGNTGDDAGNKGTEGFTRAVDADHTIGTTVSLLIVYGVWKAESRSELADLIHMKGGQCRKGSTVALRRFDTE